MSSTQPRKAAPRLAQPAQRYWKGKAPKGATDAPRSDSEDDDADEQPQDDEDGDMPMDEIGQTSKAKKPPITSMSVALRDVNIDDRGKVIIAGKAESGRTVMEGMVLEARQLDALIYYVYISKRTIWRRRSVDLRRVERGLTIRSLISQEAKNQKRTRTRKRKKKRTMRKRKKINPSFSFAQSSCPSERFLVTSTYSELT